MVWSCPSAPKGRGKGLSPIWTGKESGIAQGREAAASLWGEADDCSVKNSLSKG